MNPRDALALMQFQQAQKKQESTEQYRQQKLGHQISEKEIQRAIELAQPLIKQYKFIDEIGKFELLTSCTSHTCKLLALKGSKPALDEIISFFMYTDHKFCNRQALLSQ